MRNGLCSIAMERRRWVWILIVQRVVRCPSYMRGAEIAWVLQWTSLRLDVYRYMRSRCEGSASRGLTSRENLEDSNEIYSIGEKAMLRRVS